MNDLELEDFRLTAERIRNHESKFYQILIFCITSYGVVLGLSDKIEYQHFIPIILFLILYISTIFGIGDRIAQRKDSAYLLKQYYKKDNNIFHETFYKYSHEEIEKENNNKIKKTISKIKSWFMEPFSILLILNLSSVYYFAKDFLVESYCKDIILFLIYSITILFFSALIILKILKIYKYTYQYFINLYDKFMQDITKSNNT